MPDLLNWSFQVHSTNKVLCWGTVLGHTKLLDGTDIHTSLVYSVDIADKTLKVTTKSGSLYILKFKDINTYHVNETRNALKQLGIDTSILGTCITESDNEKELLKLRLLKTLNNNDLYLEIVGTTVTQAVYKYEDKITFPYIQVHVGTFQDSVLIYDDGIVDYRYFPKVYNKLETYHISESLKSLVVNNIGSTEIRIDGIIIGSGETETIDINKLNNIDGLLSPDFENGALKEIEIYEEDENYE
jgi:hypothetical protein